MPQNDFLRRYTEAGLSLTKMTRARAQEIAKELVKTGEIQREQAQKWVDELVERSRKSTEDILEIVRSEVRKQVSQLRLVSRDDVQHLLDRFAASAGLAQRMRPGTGAKKSAAKKSPAKKSAATKSPAKKSAAKKSAPKKSGA